MNKSDIVKYSLAAIVIMMLGFYFFHHMPRPGSERNEVRKEYLEDRSFDSDKKQKAFETLKKCYNQTSINYNLNWERNCKALHDSQIQECLNKNISEKVCETNFKYSSDCSLPTIKANQISKSLEDAKEECDHFFKLEVMLITSK